MFFGAGEILQGGAEIFGGDDAEIDLQSACGEDAGLGLALAEDALDQRGILRRRLMTASPAVGSLRAQTRSMSPMVSRRRRRLPAISACLTIGQLLQAIRAASGRSPARRRSPCGRTACGRVARCPA